MDGGSGWGEFRGWRNMPPRALCPPSAALSPEYRGEGVRAASQSEGEPRDEADHDGGGAADGEADQPVVLLTFDGRRRGDGVGGPGGAGLGVAGRRRGRGRGACGLGRGAGFALIQRLLWRRGGGGG